MKGGRVLLALLLLPALPALTRASEITAPRLVAMAGAAASSAGGIDALGLNPALIGEDVNHYSFTIYPFGGFVFPLFGVSPTKSSSFNVADLDLLLSRLGANMPLYVKEYIVDGVILGEVNARTEGTIAAGVYAPSPEHAFALCISQHAAGKYTLLTGMDDTVHGIAQSGLPVPLFLRDPVNAEGVWYNSFAASYAYSPRTSHGETDYAIGVTVKFIQGLGYAKLEGENLTTISLGFVPGIGTAIQTSIDYDLRLSNRGKFDPLTLPATPLFTIFPRGVGTGFGFDIGFMRSVQVAGRTVRASLSITDLGGISWNSGPTMRSVHRIDTVQTNGAFSTFDSLKLYEGTAVTTASFSTPLPTRLHLGVSSEVPSPHGFTPHVLSFEYTQGVTSIVGNSVAPRLAIGGEWKSGIWRWATGFAFNSDEHFSWSVGSGVFFLQHLYFDIAFGRVNGLWEGPQIVNAVARLMASF